ncbi:MAG: LytTR family transcriptional regulator [Eubacterium sp.]|nr:LytTR family transcriptional regulator [Eubacterium sp.]
MKISLEHADNSELEVIIKGDISSEEAINVIAALNASAFGKLMLQGEGESFLFNATDIIYFVSEQGKTYAVTENGKYEVKEKLYVLSDSLKNKGFIQINKSTVVNINFVKSISAEFSGNYTARLKDKKEMLIISRKYFNSFKEFVRR